MPPELPAKTGRLAASTVEGVPQDRQARPEPVAEDDRDHVEAAAGVADAVPEHVLGGDAGDGLPLPPVDRLDRLAEAGACAAP